MLLRVPTLAPFLVALAYLLAPDVAQAAEVVYPPGSRLGLAPPPGMTTSSNFFGFEDPEANAAIMLTPLPAEAYADLDKTLSAELLKKEGVTLEKREPMSLAAGQAILV